jgi:YgiT-type zinc finger domain-containing protein
MKAEEHKQRWQAMSEQVMDEMLAWRREHPKASLREIEQALDGKMERLRAQILQDTAIASDSTDWRGQAVGAKCPNCGRELEPKGRGKRKLQTQGEQEILLERIYGVCPGCGRGLFPPG